MIKNKKVVEGSIVAGMLVVMTTTTVVTNHVVSNVGTMTASNTVAMAQAESHDAVAGVIEELRNTESTAILAATGVSVEQSGAQVVAAAANAGVTDAIAQDIAATESETVDATATDVITADVAATDTETAVAEPSTEATTEAATETTESEQSDKTSIVASEVVTTETTDITIKTDAVKAQLAEEEAQWANRLMPTVDEYLNIRATADENGTVVGKLYKGDAADVVEKGDTWTHITSGSVDGYVLNEYCAFGSDAYALAQADCTTDATVMTGGLRLRSEPNETSSVIDAVYEGQILTVSTEAQSVDGWVAVEYDSQLAYVSAQYVDIQMGVGNAISIEEENAQKAAEAAEKGTTTTQKAAVAASTDEVTLLGALIQLEAGSECYEGKVAVGAVVMNRVRSGSYPSSISGVIYQGGQFTTAGNVAGVVSSGVSGSCMQAAQEAINGADNTGGCVSFRRASSGRAGTVIGNHVFF